MVALLDVNVLVALLVPEHEHHIRALDFFATDAVRHGWATCPVTELGVIRVCAQLPGGAWPPDRTAGGLFLRTSSSSGYVWWPDLVSPVALPEVRSAATGKQGLARRNSSRIATFDRALATFGGHDVTCLLTAIY